MVNSIRFGGRKTLFFAFVTIATIGHSAAIAQMEQMDSTIHPEIIEPPIAASTPEVSSSVYDMSVADCHTPSVIAESTGTWLRRGWWYAQLDAVVMQRQWSHNDEILAGSTDALSDLRLKRGSPAAEGMARLTLGRFLFRDIHNRDHTTEFTAFGGGNFSQSTSLTPDGENAVGIFTRIDRNHEQSFNGADSTAIDYDSRFNSFEWNYRLSTRMERDRVELQPNGEWIRRANPGLSYQFLAGMRYIDLTENANWTATNIVDTDGVLDGEDGVYLGHTSNDMFGFQIGGGGMYEADRWNFGVFTKGGVLFNDAKKRTSLTYFEDGVQQTDLGFAHSRREGTMPFVIQSSLSGSYHLRPNLSLRAGYELMYITAIALAPHQMDFNPADGPVIVSGDSFYHGISLGMDYYW